MRKKTLGLLVGALVTTSVLAGYNVKGDNMAPAKAAIIETRTDKMKDGDMMKDKSDKMMEDDMKKGKSDDMMKDDDKMMKDGMKDGESDGMMKDDMKKDKSDDMMKDGMKDKSDSMMDEDMMKDKSDKMMDGDMKKGKSNKKMKMKKKKAGKKMKMKMKKKNGKKMKKSDNMMKDNMKKDKSDKMMEDDNMMQDEMKHEQSCGKKKCKSNNKKNCKKNCKSDKMMQDEMKDSKSMMKDRMMNNKEMYDFTLKDLDGNDYKLSDNKGKKVYMKFWASWCSICLTGLEDLDKLAGENNDFEIVTVVAPGKNREMDTAAFKKWFKELGYKNLKVLFDETGEVTEHYGVKVYPTSVYVSSNGTDTTVKAGHNSNDDIKDTIKKIK